MNRLRYWFGYQLTESDWQELARKEMRRISTNHIKHLLDMILKSVGE